MTDMHPTATHVAPSTSARMPANVYVAIEHWGQQGQPLLDLADLRALTSHLPDDTPIYATFDERGDFSGVQIGGTV